MSKLLNSTWGVNAFSGIFVARASVRRRCKDVSNCGRMEDLASSICNEWVKSLFATKWRSLFAAIVHQKDERRKLEEGGFTLEVRPTKLLSETCAYLRVCLALAGGRTGNN